MASKQKLAVPTPWDWQTFRCLLLVVCAPLAAELLGSVFNIWYNLTHIQPLLTSTQLTVFVKTIGVYNAVVYPIATTVWVWVVFSLWRPCQRLQHAQPVKKECLLRARQRVINLPWLGAIIAGSGWVLCIPVFLLTLQQVPGRLDSRVLVDLPISIAISALIAITHGFFAVELLSQRLLYPILFREAKPAQTSGTFPVSLRSRGVLLAFSAVVCPITSLLLLNLAPHRCESQAVWFAIAVGGLGIIFGLMSAAMLGRLVIQPVEALQHAAKAVATGNLNSRITLLRADEFGHLIDEFNHLVEELQEKQHLQETFGRHVGQKAAQQILQRDPNLGGIEQEVTVLFADLRNFTARSTVASPQQVVTLLNLFLTEMVEIVEQQYEGMVNKFLGDGFMALFGVGEQHINHAALAVAAGQEMLDRLEHINRHLATQGLSPLAMGIGIHTGRAVVGSIGSPQRLEYTAIGNTVNIASRVESLTKVLKEPLLFTAATRSALPTQMMTEALPPQQVKGQPQPLSVYRIQLPISRDAI
ncbi:MAG TPA: adenylate/guanylate cyclase domain-containing protein [Coleofasciculaceae cyanobacterium]